jgi:hypothetical protein
LRPRSAFALTRRTRRSSCSASRWLSCRPRRATWAPSSGTIEGLALVGFRASGPPLSIVYHLTNHIPITIVGLVYLIALNLTLGDLRVASEKTREPPGGTGPEPSDRDSPSGLALSVVIPVYNEEDNVSLLTCGRVESFGGRTGDRRRRRLEDGTWPRRVS